MGFCGKNGRNLLTGQIISTRIFHRNAENIANIMILLQNISVLAKHTMCRASLYSFWENLSGPMFDLFWDRSACNHSLCTGSTVVGQCMEQLPNGYAYRRINQTDSLTDLIKHTPLSVFL